jgi:hypothetical protein
VTLDIGVRLGPYEITGAIGAGGMGEVYRAHEASRPRHAKGKVSTHWRSPVSGSTRSIRLAAVAFIRRPMHEGPKPRPLQLNATSRVSSHPSHLSRAKPR